MNTKNKTTKITTINVRIDDELKERIAAIAAYQDMTISQLVRGWYEYLVEIEEDMIDQVKRQLGEE